MSNSDSIVSDDPFGKGKEFNWKGADPRSVADFHRRSDVDSSPFAQHHTIGLGRNQSAAGDHRHFGEKAIAWQVGNYSAVTATLVDLIIADILDTNNIYDVATGVFTIKKPGFYRISGSMCFGVRVAVANHLLLMAVVNGSENNGARWSAPGNVAATIQGCSGNIVLFLTVNDTVKFQTYQDSGATINVSRINLVVEMIWS